MNDNRTATTATRFDKPTMRHHACGQPGEYDARIITCTGCMEVASPAADNQQPASTAAPAASNFQCPQCCAPAGQPCASTCPAGLASAARMAIGMLEVLDTARLPLAVAASFGVLRCGLKEAQGERPAVPEGYQLVPIKPTPKMVDATFNDPQERGGSESHNARNKRVYAAMLTVAATIEGIMPPKDSVGLSFSALRQANTLRLPQFKNRHGELAHRKADGSDWSPSQWLQALVGELGEFANVRKKFERGDLTFDQYRTLAEKELADVQTYLDLLARRALDIGPNAHETGVDLGEATRQKFNEVSHRVGADVFIDDAGKVYGAQIAHEGGVA
jgi:NTP pyrophosphatase (non-canonical NTP hydrolase)